MDDDVLVLPPLPADPVFVDAVEAAVAGDADLPDAQPQRRVGADPHDFASLYIRHRSSFALHARRFLHDPRDVDEVLQEAFLRLFLAMPELDNELQALSYCRRTVTNLCIDRWRADQRRPRLVDLETMQLDPRDQASYDDPVLRAEDAAIVREALALLSPLHRAALVKREIEEKPLPQIAAELGVPEESVKHLLHRARRALRRLLVGTSVEPGVDLSNTQCLRLANQRLARATLRSANVLIVLFVAAVTVVGGLRVPHDDHSTRSGEVTSAVTPGVVEGTGIEPAPPAPAPVDDSSQRPRHRESAPPPPPPPAAVATASPAEVRPVREHVNPAPPKQMHVSTARSVPRYSLTGPGQVTGAVRVRSLSRDLESTGSVSSTTQLVAPLDVGTFALTQTLLQDSTDGSAVVSVQPTITSGVVAVQPAVVSSATTVSRAPSGDLTIDVDAKTAPAADAAIQLTGLTAHIVLDGDLMTVISESVAVTSDATSDVSVTKCERSTTATSAAALTSQPGTLVIGMSPAGSDDQSHTCSSSTDGGSFPLLPPQPVRP